MLSDLEKIGLTKNEAKVYLCLLNNGLITVGSILKQTRFHRTTLYNVLSRLKEKGLVSSIIKGKKNYFSAADPERLKIIAEEKNQLIKQLVPQLKKIKSNLNSESEVQYFVGFEGLKTVYNDILKTKKKLYWLWCEAKNRKSFKILHETFCQRKD